MIIALIGLGIGSLISTMTAIPYKTGLTVLEYTDPTPKLAAYKSSLPSKPYERILVLEYG